MDTKWKKWKSIVSLTACLLGIYLVVLHGFLDENHVFGKLLKGEMNEIRQELDVDYQNSQEFRSFVSARLEQMLTMAAGGELSENYGVVYESGLWEEGDSFWDFWSDLEDTFRYFPIETVLFTESAEAIETAMEETESWTEEIWESERAKAAAQEKSAEEVRRKQEARARHEQWEPDKNLLYQIWYEDELLYTNAEGCTLDGAETRLPEGYNFLLYFDGEKVHIQKDGAVVDVYGDEYYDPETDEWYVPGYRNFSIDEVSKQVRIVMAIAEQPRLYVQGNYEEYGAGEYGSQLYWLCQQIGWKREQFLRNSLLFFLGIILLAASFVMRKVKREADQSLARLTQRSCVELNWLLGLGVPAFAGCGLYSLCTWNSIWEINGLWIWCFLILVPLYLWINDLRYNRGKHRSIFGWLWKKIAWMFRGRELRMSIQRQMVYHLRSASLLLVLSLVLVILSLFVVYVMCWDERLVYGPLLVACLSLILGFGMLICHGIRSERNAEDIGALDAQITAIHGGNLTEKLKVPQNNDLHQMAEKLNEIQQGMHHALEEQMKSERMKVELISNVSHDIKTPLTSIISYVELLKQEEQLPEHVRDYIEILGRKSERLKGMVQDVFEVSKASSGQLPVKLETLDLSRLICQTLADMDEQIRDSGLVLKTELPEKEVLILADGQRMYRVFQNLLQNALKYSLPGSRIHVSLSLEAGEAVARIQNISRAELSEEMDFTWRFVRGDASRSDGGSGLGLSIAQSFTEACGGRFRVGVNADLFTAEVIFVCCSKTEESRQQPCAMQKN